MIRLQLCAAAILLLFRAAPGLGAEDQGTRLLLFRAADAALETAREARAEQLSPNNFKLAMKSYRAAEGRFQRGGNLDRVRSELASATQSFAAATEAAKQASVTLANALKGRDAALAAGASGQDPAAWEKAEREFTLAARELELGNLENARERGGRAESLYRDAELTAIKQAYLGDIRNLLDTARQHKAKRYAPLTLARAEGLAEQAERELENNRYDADLPRSLAREAAYEARHAIYLSGYVRALRDRNASEEEIILEWEQPLREVAAAADLVAGFDDGFAAPTAAVKDFIEALRAENRDLQEEIKMNRQRIVGLEDEIVDLDERLGGAREERVMLAQQLAMQERVREQVRQVDAMFDRQQAQVFREGNDILIRLIGLGFPVGTATIEPRHRELLAQVQKAIRVFPRSQLIVEGHTDSHGSDDLNLKLSQQRAEAVRHYLVTEMRIDPGRASATGYGETVPVANNETPEGRARNRRIDIRIRPVLNIT
jgi:outer membrane protein OmpA-like peptidoglycan-associated protein